MGSGARAPTFHMTVLVREATAADLVATAGIESASFSDPWTRGMFASHLVAVGGNCFLVADDGDGTVIGFAITRTVSGESELLNIAVDSARRNRGIGALLLDAAMDRCREAGGQEMWLEVRASNAGARTLYAARGFAEAGVRKRYYQAPREDAIVLRADLRTESVTCAEHSLTADPDEPILLRASHHPRQETK